MCIIIIENKIAIAMKQKHKKKKTGGIRTKPRPGFIGEPLGIQIDD